MRNSIMKKANQQENKQYHTHTRASFLRVLMHCLDPDECGCVQDRIDNRCSSSMFKKYVSELHRLENILQSGTDGRKMRPDVYDRKVRTARTFRCPSNSRCWGTAACVAAPELAGSQQPCAPQQQHAHGCVALEPCAAGQCRPVRARAGAPHVCVHIRCRHV